MRLLVLPLLGLAMRFMQLLLHGCLSVTNKYSGSLNPKNFPKTWENLADKERDKRGGVFSLMDVAVEVRSIWQYHWLARITSHTRLPQVFQLPLALISQPQTIWWSGYVLPT